MDPETAARRGFNPRDFDPGYKLRLVDGEHDVFGDGSVVCLGRTGTRRGTSRSPLLLLLRETRHRPPPAAATTTVAADD
jgi:hypothetical protein